MFTQRRTAVAALISATACAGFSAYKSLSNGDNHTESVLFVGDFDHATSLLSELKKDLRSAISRSVEQGHTGYLRPAFLDIAEFQASADSDQLKSKLRSVLLRDIARQHPLAIVCGTTTNYADAVIDVGETLRIPVILSVATNDDLLRRHKGRYAFRVVPADRKQGEAIAAWCNALHGSGPVHILHDQSKYALDLFDLILPQIGRPVLTSPLSASTDAAAALLEGKSAGCAGTLVIAYSEDARNVATWADALSISSPMLMSDGASGSWIAKTHMGALDLSISYPMLPKAEGSAQDAAETGPPSLAGYQPVAIRTFMFLADTWDAVVQQDGSRSDFIGLLRSGAAEVSPSRTDFRPAFNRDGEDDSARFVILPIHTHPK